LEVLQKILIFYT